MTRLFAAALLAATAACSVAAAAERSFPATGFDRVMASGSEDVSITTGKAASVIATGPADRLDRLDIRVDKGVLVIGHKGNDWGYGSSQPVRVLITMPALHGVTGTGSGNITADRGTGPAFSGRLSGSGDLAIAAIDSPQVELAISGSGNVSAAGKCQAASLSISGSGDMALDRLACQSLDVKISGSGNVDARASGNATIKISGSGDVKVAGGARCQSKSSGSGDVTCS